MHDVLAPLYDRLGRLEQAVQDLQPQLAALLSAGGSPAQQVLDRLTACEDELGGKASLVSVDLLAQGLSARFGAQCQGLWEELERRPAAPSADHESGVAAGGAGAPWGCAGAILGAVGSISQIGVSEAPLRRPRSASGAASDGESSSSSSAGGSGREELRLHQQPSTTLSLVVAHIPAARLEGGEAVDGRAEPSGEVTVEAQSSERVSAVKQRAHEQLGVWHRFRQLGEPDDAGEAEALPPLNACRLCRTTPGGGEAMRPAPLQERRRLAECNLEDGAHLFLVAEDRRVDEVQTIQPAACEQLGAASRPPDTASRLHLVVAHAGSEVTLEAAPSQSVAALKRQALAQLGVWQRFQALGDNGACKPPELPPRQACQLHTLGPALAERQRLWECGLAEGARLELRSSVPSPPR